MNQYLNREQRQKPDFPSERKRPRTRGSKDPGKGNGGCNDKDKDGKNKDGSGKPPPGSQGPPAQKTNGLWGSNNTYEAETQPNESYQSRGGARDSQRSHAPFEVSQQEYAI